MPVEHRGHIVVLSVLISVHLSVIIRFKDGHLRSNLCSNCQKRYQLKGFEKLRKVNYPVFNFRFSFQEKSEKTMPVLLLAYQLTHTSLLGA